MGKESLMRCIRRKIATVLMLVVTITQSPLAEVFGTGVLRAQALEPAEVEIYQSRTSPYKFMSFETPEYEIFPPTFTIAVTGFILNSSPDFLPNKGKTALP